MCTLCDSTDIYTIIEFVPSVCTIYQPSVLGFLLEEKEHKPDPWRNPIERNHMGLHLENEVYCVWQVLNTPTITFNNPVLILPSHPWQSLPVISSAFIQNSVCISHTSHGCYFVKHYILLGLLTLILFRQKGQLWSFNPCNFCSNFLLNKFSVFA